MAAWSDFVDNLFGKSAGSYDPYAKDRANREALMRSSMANYDQMMSQPFGFIPQAYQDQMRKDVNTQVNNQYAGQGQSGFTNDRLARAQNDLSMKFMNTNLDQANKQRDYIQQLTMASQPTQYQKAQIGLLPQAGGQFLSQTANQFGTQAANYASDKLWGDSANDDERNKQRYTGGMSVGQG